MRKQLWRYFVAACTLAMTSSLVPSATAQTSEVKEKPPLYSYVADWSIPRAQWPEMEKANASDKAILDKAIANGTLVGYGDDTSLVHQPDGTTHDDWWSSMSMAGLLNVLDEMTKSGTPASPVLASATKHSDYIFVSRHYNWHSGSWKGVYTRVGSYKLKADAPDDALEVLSKNMIVPLLEKLLADGTIHQYEIDTQAIHSTDPASFWIVYIAANAEGLDKVNAALQAMSKASPLNGTAFDSVVDSTKHRDELLRANATFK